MTKMTRAELRAPRGAGARERVCRVGTFLEEPSLAAGLTAAIGKARLLFAGWQSDGEGSSGMMEYYIAGSDCGRFDVLWLKSDWCEGLCARAWSPRGGLPRKRLWEALLMACWKAEKATQELESPPFNEIASDSGVMAPEKIWELVGKVWETENSGYNY